MEEEAQSKVIKHVYHTEHAAAKEESCSSTECHWNFNKGQLRK
jgi:hypothetical protein